jgi:hypothetical protein
MVRQISVRARVLLSPANVKYIAPHVSMPMFSILFRTAPTIVPAHRNRTSSGNFKPTRWKRYVVPIFSESDPRRSSALTLLPSTAPLPEKSQANKPPRALLRGLSTLQLRPPTPVSASTTRSVGSTASPDVKSSTAQQGPSGKPRARATSGRWCCHSMRITGRM